MPYRTDITYCYDGSLAGLMCCIHESYYRSELPEVIFTLEEEQGTIFEIRHIETNQEHARKVETAISAKISSEALDLIQKAFLTQLPRKEIHILSFLRLGFQKGAKILTMLTDDRVAVLHKAVSHLEKESALYRVLYAFPRSAAFWSR
jgi:probable DNA metabolism protein